MHWWWKAVGTKPVDRFVDGKVARGGSDVPVRMVTVVTLLGGVGGWLGPGHRRAVLQPAFALMVPYYPLTNQSSDIPA